MRLLNLILASSIFFTTALCLDKKVMLKKALKRCLQDCSAASKTLDLEDVDVRCTRCIYKLKKHPCHPCAVAKMAGVSADQEHAACFRCYDYTGIYLD